ncbi:hypothetical protein WOLCODRAFT_138657 [Wolfiporia cocos MD-104 SS10]|uniref:Mediator of RNA polymerase II transcription subunit 12 n=1 Tax=Wolfiporia cocos (strain MD-104) TaxID=742152 RepID=A0A2H3JQV7_WOLCO|nr:hypothetical protein WOLCODRAFT_138657 [Wolfiporia cocos MD-104 SS10]
MANGEQDPLPIYELHPPDWLPKAHASADLGYIGFYPPRPDEVEEVLTETNVKNGLILNLSVPAETYSQQDSIKNSLIYENAVTELEDLMNMIFARRAENVPAVPQSTFRMPSRITLNDAKREAWFTDLANPDVPLYKLGKNVPHGAKGHDLLDLLHMKNVAIPRAVWFLRVFGGNETAGLRNKPGYNPTQYSIEWANVVTGYIRKQLADIALPTAPRPGLNIKQTFKSKLADQDSRENWISRFTYSLELLRSFYSEGLVDNKTFLAWLVQQVGSCNLAQLGFVARLADEYLDGMLISRALTHHFVEACLSKLAEIRSTSAKDHLTNLEAMLKNLVTQCFLALPDAFVSPRMWATHCNLVEEILAESIEMSGSDGIPAQNIQALQQTCADRFADVKRRNEAMFFRQLPPRVVGSLTSALTDIKLLNSLSGQTDMSTIIFFEDAPAFVRKLDTLLTWSVTGLQYGDHRPYAAACLLRQWRAKAGARALRHEAESPDVYIQDSVFDWLDSSTDAADPDNLPAVALLFGQLVKDGLFSYQEYIQRLIARGEPGLSFSEEEHSRHRNFLRWIPLHSSDSSLIRQRKVTLYGVRARETPEDAHEREIRKEIRALFPEVFGGLPSTEPLTTTFWESCSTLLSSPRYEQVRTIKQWFLPIIRKHIASQAQVDTSNNGDILKTYTLSIILMARTRCYGSILDLTLYALERATTLQLLTVVIETLRQHMEVWACMDVMRTVAGALYSAHQFWRNRGIQTRALLCLLMKVDHEQYLEPEQRGQINSDISAYSHALYPGNHQSDSVPVILPEILLLATDSNVEAPSNLAKSLWYKYMTASDWAWNVWDNTIASLRQVPVMIPDLEGRRACALRYANFLWHVDQHLPRGFDKQVLDWFLGAGKNEVAALSPEAWDVVTVVLLHLCVCGALNTTSILKGLIYPVWQTGAYTTSLEQGQALEVLLTAANNLFEHLLIKDECGNGLPPADIFEAQGLQTRRRDVFREPHFSLMVESMPALVLIEQNAYLPENVKLECGRLRQAICRVSVFRLGVYRDLDAVRLAFQKLLECRSIPEELHEPLVTALRLMLRDPGQATDNTGFVAVSSLLTPWKLAATSIEVRLTLKQLGEGLSRESTRNVANATLNKLSTFVYQQCKTPEEADFVAEMMTDVDREVAGKFVNAGLQRIIEIFREPFATTDPKTMVQFVSDAGEVLRLLSKIVERFRSDGSLPPLLQPIQDQFITALDFRFAEVVSGRTGELDDSQARELSHSAIFLARLLQFNLGFPGAWTSQTKAVSERLCKTLTELALIHGEGEELDAVAFPLLLDTLHYVLDEAPSDPKATTCDPFRNYPNIALADLPAGMPPAYRARFRTLLPHFALNAAVDGLAYATRDPSTGALTLTQPVQNRPWEWTEFLGDVPPGGEEHDMDPFVVKNSASLNLELFEARATGERLINSDEPAAVYAFQDSLSSESVFMRDWRETRVISDQGVRC